MHTRVLMDVTMRIVVWVRKRVVKPDKLRTCHAVARGGRRGNFEQRKARFLCEFD